MLGTKLRNRYYIFKELGVGGFGQTFLAQDCDFPGQPWCVVKQLKPQVKEPWMLQTARRLFDLEASVLARIGSHPQIPQLKAHFEEDEQFYLVQDFIEGDLLSKELKDGQIWSQEQAIFFLEDTLEVLKFIHENQVIHRDLKPENIIRRQSDQKLVLIDFGSVKKITTLYDQEREESGFTVAIGTPAYMPMEQQGGKPSYNSDIYALGKIVIQGLTGVSPKRLNDDPQTGELLWRHLVNIDDVFAEILSGMVKWNARDRYQSVPEVIHDLSPYFQKLPSGLTPKKRAKTKTGSTLDKIVRNLKQNPEITRIKKLLFCAYKHRWENSPRILSKYRTKYLIQELWKREKSINDFKNSINDVVKTLNKKDKYQLVANFIINEVTLLYDLSNPLSEEEPEDHVSSKVTEIRRAGANQTNSSSGQTNLKKREESESLIVSQQSYKNETEVCQESDSPDAGLEDTSIPSQIVAGGAWGEANGNHCSLFDLRYEITRYTTPLRIKILLFSMLYYKIGFSEQDWSLMMSHQLDSLLKQIIQMFPNLSELESRLYETARHFNQEEGLTQVVGAIIQSLRPFYEKGQPTLTH
ncbi:serine/threonine protein kinase [Halothece sp. PCC 7418]|uniref:serine/threonine-protein kinase n=1 Tax=Halothece sp. (strain PCC 7418) TaxID=65093 RepID=UPI0002A06ABF|nr:serine/threonine-protein kinase [Halothece sp. PCC 7418]AFZ42959.1 serine/threonine protein kinase [Halothece sp. PCC 7418]